MPDIVIRPSMKFIKAGYAVTFLVIAAAVFLHLSRGVGQCFGETEASNLFAQTRDLVDDAPQNPALENALR